MELLTQIFTGLGNHFRLTWRLMKDNRVTALSKAIVVVIPLLYLLYPRDVSSDYYPLIGLLDDMILLGFCTVIFVTVANQSVVQEHRAAIKGSPVGEPIPLDRYRHKSEKRNLSFGFGAAILLILFSGSLAGITLLIVFLATIAYTYIDMSKKMKSMTEVSETQYPKIYKAFKKAQENLPDAKVRLLVEENPTMNAYTFGIKEPYPVVLHSALVEKMSPKELQAIIGHEMGHILLNHTFLTCLVAAPKNFIGQLLFFKWSRTAEHSCDAMAWVATGKNLKPVASALIRLSDAKVGDIDIESFLENKGGLARLMEAMPTFFSTHPSVYKRVLHLVKIEEQAAKTGQ